MTLVVILERCRQKRVHLRDQLCLLGEFEGRCLHPLLDQWARLPRHMRARNRLRSMYAGAPDKAMEMLEPGFAIAPGDADALTARDSARTNLDQAVKSDAAFPGGEGALSTPANLFRKKCSAVRARRERKPRLDAA